MILKFNHCAVPNSDIKIHTFQRTPHLHYAVYSAATECVSQSFQHWHPSVLPCHLHNTISLCFHLRGLVFSYPTSRSHLSCASFETKTFRKSSAILYRIFPTGWTAPVHSKASMCSVQPAGSVLLFLEYLISFCKTNDRIPGSTNWEYRESKIHCR